MHYFTHFGVSRMHYFTYYGISRMHYFTYFGVSRMHFLYQPAKVMSHILVIYVIAISLQCRGIFLHFFRKYLVSSQKSSTLAPAFEEGTIRCTKEGCTACAMYEGGMYRLRYVRRTDVRDEPLPTENLKERRSKRASLPLNVRKERLYH